MKRRDVIKTGVVVLLLTVTGVMALSLTGCEDNIIETEKKTENVRRAKRVVLIALDGISVPGFLEAKTPNLDALFSEGAFSLTTRVVMPSITLPNFTSHLTGSGPEQHGVCDNDWTVNKYVLPAVEKDSEGYYPSVFTVLKKNVPGIKIAFYYNWINLFYPYNRKFFDEVNYLKDDAYIPNLEKAFDFIENNREDPMLVFWYSGHTDNTGHAYKWMSPEYLRSIEEADMEIGRFLAKLQIEGLYRETHFIFITDHGGVNYGHGGLTVDEMLVPWGITGPGIKRRFTIEEPNNIVNTAATILYLFNVKQPASWIGEVPFTIFK